MPGNFSPRTPHSRPAWMALSSGSLPPRPLMDLAGTGEQGRCRRWASSRGSPRSPRPGLPPARRRRGDGAGWPAWPRRWSCGCSGALRSPPRPPAVARLMLVSTRPSMSWLMASTPWGRAFRRSRTRRPGRLVQTAPVPQLSDTSNRRSGSTGRYSSRMAASSGSTASVNAARPAAGITTRAEASRARALCLPPPGSRRGGRAVCVESPGQELDGVAPLQMDLHPRVPALEPGELEVEHDRPLVEPEPSSAAARSGWWPRRAQPMVTAFSSSESRLRRPATLERDGLGVEGQHARQAGLLVHGEQQLQRTVDEVVRLHHGQRSRPPRRRCPPPGSCPWPSPSRPPGGGRSDRGRSRGTPPRSSRSPCPGGPGGPRSAPLPCRGTRASPRRGCRSRPAGGAGLCARSGPGRTAASPPPSWRDAGWRGSRRSASRRASVPARRQRTCGNPPVRTPLCYSADRSIRSQNLVGGGPP